MITKFKFLGAEWSLVALYALLWTVNAVWLLVFPLTAAFEDYGWLGWTYFTIHFTATLMLAPWVFKMINKVLEDL